MAHRTYAPHLVLLLFCALPLSGCSKKSEAQASPDLELPDDVTSTRLSPARSAGEKHDHNHHDHDHHGHDHHDSTPTPPDTTAVRPEIPDVLLTDQNGKQVHFYTDLVKGKLVLMNSIFTRCPATCPIQSRAFAGVQRALGERLGKDVHLISVTLDPEYDTPERLKEFAGRYGAQPGWSLLTGPKADVTRLLKAMDLYSAKPEDHTPMAAAGYDPTGVWMKTLNLSSPQELISKLDYVAAVDLAQVAGKKR